MGTYIVTFKNNKAISSRKIDSEEHDLLKIEEIKDDDEIRSMTIFANSEEKSLERANVIANHIISTLHSFPSDMALPYSPVKEPTLALPDSYF